jgi:pimeloyl-ACP methyl ester carboxylesterase
MKKIICLIALVYCTRLSAQADLNWSKDSPAGFMELQINSAGSLMQGFMYKANGSRPHPTLLLLHGFPGNERNLDLAQAVRAHGWNVIYFNYRGSWGQPGRIFFQALRGRCKEPDRLV